MGKTERPITQGGTVSDEKDATKGAGRPGLMARLRSAMHPSHRARKRLMWLGLAVLALAVLVVAPGYYASQPGYLARYPNLSAPYKAWATSKHKDVSCESCHVPPTITARLAHSATMVGQFYLSLVSPGRQLDAYPPPTNASCQGCHESLISVSPSGDLIIPHRAHVDVLGLQCVRCHSNLVHHPDAAGRDIPLMAGCLTCHDGKQAKNTCTTCHTAKATPESHRAANWDTIHPQEVGKVDCAACHAWTVNWCADCHARRPRSHTATWRVDHPLAVKTHRNCEVCHTGGFCIRCHGVVPSLNFNPALKLVK